MCLVDFGSLPGAEGYPGFYWSGPSFLLPFFRIVCFAVFSLFTSFWGHFFDDFPCFGHHFSEHGFCIDFSYSTSHNNTPPPHG